MSQYRRVSQRDNEPRYLVPSSTSPPPPVLAWTGGGGVSMKGGRSTSSGMRVGDPVPESVSNGANRGMGQPMPGPQPILGGYDPRMNAPSAEVAGALRVIHDDSPILVWNSTAHPYRGYCSMGFDLLVKFLALGLFVIAFVELLWTPPSGRAIPLVYHWWLSLVAASLSLIWVGFVYFLKAKQLPDADVAKRKTEQNWPNPPELNWRVPAIAFAFYAASVGFLTYLNYTAEPTILDYNRLLLVAMTTNACGGVAALQNWLILVRIPGSIVNVL